MRAPSLLAAGLSLACGAALEANTSLVHFGEVYVGTSSERQVVLSETGGTDVHLQAPLLAETDSSSFSTVAPPPPPIVVTANGSTPVTLKFSPREARRHGDAHLRFLSVTPVSFSNDFPILLRGIGVYQKSDSSLQIEPGDHSPSEPLEFGQVRVGESAQQLFVIHNTSNQALRTTLHWVQANPAFTALQGGAPVVIPARSRAFIALRFTPTRLGERTAIVELRSGTSFAGIVLHGTGVLMPVAIDSASFTPATVSPGESITVRYALSHPAGAQEVSSVTLEGLPSNVPTPTLPRPAANGAIMQQSIQLGPPAMDGIYPLRLVVQQVGGTPIVKELGKLTVRDTPASIIGPAIRDDHHSRGQCELTLLPRVIEYRVRDDNGASDVYLARIDALQPLPGADGLLTLPPTVPLLMPSNPNVVEDVATTNIDVNCRSRPQTWTLILKWQEDDKTVEPVGQTERLRVTLPYQVAP